MWNLTFLYCMSKDHVEPERFCQAVNKVIGHYSIFGTIFAFNEHSTLIQKYDASKKRYLTIEHMTEAEFLKIKEQIVKPFVMLERALFDMHIIETEENL